MFCYNFEGPLIVLLDLGEQEGWGQQQGAIASAAGLILSREKWLFISAGESWEKYFLGGGEVFVSVGLLWKPCTDLAGSVAPLSTAYEAWEQQMFVSRSFLEGCLLVLGRAGMVGPWLPLGCWGLWFGVCHGVPGSSNLVPACCRRWAV